MHKDATGLEELYEKKGTEKEKDKSPDKTIDQGVSFKRNLF